VGGIKKKKKVKTGSRTERHRERKNSNGLQGREGGIKKSWQGARQGQMAKEMKSHCAQGREGRN